MPQNYDDGKIEAIEEFLTPDTLYEGLIKRVRKYHPSDDISLIEKAYNQAAEAHHGQLRKSGEPYIIHPLCVAIILAEGFFMMSLKIPSGPRRKFRNHLALMSLFWLMELPN